MNAIIPHSVNYSQTLGLVESVAALLGQHPAGVVTIFFPTMELTIIHISQCLMPFSPMSPWLTKWHSSMLLTPFSTMAPFYRCLLPVWPLCQACNSLSQFKEISFSSARLMPLHGFKHLLHRSYNQPNLYLAPGEIAVHDIKQCSFSSWHDVLELRGTGSLP